MRVLGAKELLDTSLKGAATRTGESAGAWLRGGVHELAPVDIREESDLPCESSVLMLAFGE